LSRDSWGGDYESPLTLNKWNYVNDNPVTLTDPSGHCAPVCVVVGVGIVAVVIVGIVYIAQLPQPEISQQQANDIAFSIDRAFSTLSGGIQRGNTHLLDMANITAYAAQTLAQYGVTEFKQFTLEQLQNKPVGFPLDQNPPSPIYVFPLPLQEQTRPLIFPVGNDADKQCSSSPFPLDSGIHLPPYAPPTSLNEFKLRLINLATVSGGGSGSDLDKWKAKKPFEGTIRLPDGTTIESVVRQTPGADGGWSRIIRVKNADGETIKVVHEAWNGTSDPRFDPPDHRDIKFEK